MEWLGYLIVGVGLVAWLIAYIASHQRSAQDEDRIARSLRARYEQQKEDEQ